MCIPIGVRDLADLVNSQRATSSLVVVLKEHPILVKLLKPTSSVDKGGLRPGQAPIIIRDNRGIRNQAEAVLEKVTLNDRSGLTTNGRHDSRVRAARPSDAIDIVVVGIRTVRELDLEPEAPSF